MVREYPKSASPVFAVLLTAALVVTGALNVSPPTASAGDSSVLPYDDGGGGSIPSAAARICNVDWSSVPGGSAFAFEIEVFDICWEPIYSIEITEVAGRSVTAAAWPSGWSVRQLPDVGLGSGSVVFETSSDPIVPGSRLGGFAVASESSRLTLRWYPTDRTGVLVGKITLITLASPTAAPTTTWGGIKALYK